MSMEFDNHEQFFERVGKSYVYPTLYGECIWPVSIEEMYQHFKARLLSEIAVVSPELLNTAQVVDVVQNRKEGAA